ncbi:MAG TPA: hypothetical protein VGX78_10255 [Pirellulales bacterium]|jgi:hypothetical protein|nr:hypothetical protein [Pirellulales bacterium]
MTTTATRKRAGGGAGNVFDLDHLLATVATPGQRETARCRWRTATRALGRPLTGAWYWVPLPAGGGAVSWDVQVFFDVWRPSSDHVVVWKHVVDSLAYHWRRRLARVDYASLPRGRVCRRITDAKGDYDDDAVPVIYHGNDTPRGGGGLARVRRAFNLPRSAVAKFDDHERCIAGQPEAMSRALGIDLRLKGVEVSDVDWGKDEGC